MINLGGNLLKTIQSPLNSEVQFANDPYTYKFISLVSAKSFLVEALSTVCIFLLDGSVESEGHMLSEPGDALLVENKKFSIVGKITKS